MTSAPLVGRFAGAAGLRADAPVTVGASVLAYRP